MLDLLETRLVFVALRHDFAHILGCFAFELSFQIVDHGFETEQLHLRDDARFGERAGHLELAGLEFKALAQSTLARFDLVASRVEEQVLGLDEVRMALDQSGGKVDFQGLGRFGLETRNLSQQVVSLREALVIGGLEVGVIDLGQLSALLHALSLSSVDPRNDSAFETLYDLQAGRRNDLALSPSELAHLRLIGPDEAGDHEAYDGEQEKIRIRHFLLQEGDFAVGYEVQVFGGDRFAFVWRFLAHQLRPAPPESWRMTSVFGPSAAILPWSITMMRSASFSIDGLWVERMRVRPPSLE